MDQEIELKESEVTLRAIRAQGSGGQHVNKVSSAIHLRFDISASSLSEPLKKRLLALKDSRISKEGVLVMKVQDTRSQDMNRILAWARLSDLIQACAKVPKTRRATRPKRSSIEQRLEDKKKRFKLKSSRGFMKD